MSYRARGESSKTQTYSGKGRNNSAGRPKHHEDRTAQLPKSLLEQIEGPSADSSESPHQSPFCALHSRLMYFLILLPLGAPGRRGGHGPLSRKDERKYARSSTKGPSQARPKYTPSNDASQPSLSLTPADSVSHTKKRKRPEKASAGDDSGSKKLATSTSTPLSRLAGNESKKKKKLPTSAEVLGTAGGGAGGGGVNSAEAEDGEIAWLEYALGRGKWKKGKGKAKQSTKDDEDDEMSDGLDGTFLLTLLDLAELCLMLTGVQTLCRLAGRPRPTRPGPLRRHGRERQRG